MTRPSPYGWLMLAAIIVTIGFWSRLAKRDDRLLAVYVSALIGAFLGAKLVYILAEGWLHWDAPDRWLQLATGKSVLGALLGGYVAVELAKKWLGYAGTTGDWFAFIAPIGIMIGRVGCFFHGCCVGVVCESRWYALKDAQGAPPDGKFIRRTMAAIGMSDGSRLGSSRLLTLWPPSSGAWSLP